MPSGSRDPGAPWAAIRGHHGGGRDRDPGVRHGPVAGATRLVLSRDATRSVITPPGQRPGATIWRVFRGICSSCAPLVRSQTAKTPTRSVLKHFYGLSDGVALPSPVRDALVSQRETERPSIQARIVSLTDTELFH